MVLCCGCAVVVRLCGCSVLRCCANDFLVIAVCAVSDLFESYCARMCVGFPRSIDRRLPIHSLLDVRLSLVYFQSTF